ncbi:MAG: hypothetical protein NDJ89_02820 [Oligoflexia bacterium]|nr:hypothetical protein [Oligoflexia bacterium]
MRKFIESAGKKLDGRWVLMGGALLPVLGSSIRSTTDIDLAGLTAKEQAQSIALMELAESLGLPIEAINQAGGFFLLRIPSYEKHLKVLHQGTSATIFRPDATLYLLLKIRRLSETDLSDCLEWLRLMRKLREPIDARAVQAAIQQELKRAAGANPARQARLEELAGKFKTKIRS